MAYYIGTTPQDVLDGFIKRYFYGLRRNNDGELFFVQIDQLRGGDENIVVVNNLGISYLDGIDADHDLVYPNVRYPQFKWENRSLLYYIEPSTGFLVQRISEAYSYPTGVSTVAYGEGQDENVID